MSTSDVYVAPMKSGTISSKTVDIHGGDCMELGSRYVWDGEDV